MRLAGVNLDSGVSLEQEKLAGPSLASQAA